DERAGILLAALRLSAVHVLTVRERRSEQRRVIVVEHREALGEDPRDRHLLLGVVRHREPVIARTTREEARVALTSPVVPAVARALVTAAAEPVATGQCVDRACGHH